MIDNGNGTVTDESIGLMWQQESPKKGMTLNQAIRYCKKLTIGGYSDWRLPNFKELVSLVDYSHRDSAINTTYFPDTLPFTYWTSTVRQIHVNYNWIVEFAMGGVGGGYVQDKHHVRAVRMIDNGMAKELIDEICEILAAYADESAYSQCTRDCYPIINNHSEETFYEFDGDCKLAQKGLDLMEKLRDILRIKNDRQR